MTSITITLPWPPTANTYWRRRGNTYFISPKGIEFRNLTAVTCFHLQEFFTEKERLKVEIEAYPPDKRKRDIDNLNKCILDSLQKANVFPDDNQIDYLLIKRMPEQLNKVIITLSEII